MLKLFLHSCLLLLLGLLLLLHLRLRLLLMYLHLLLSDCLHRLLLLAQFLLHNFQQLRCFHGSVTLSEQGSFLFLKPTNEIIVTTRSRSVASAQLGYGECQKCEGVLERQKVV